MRLSLNHSGLIMRLSRFAKEIIIMALFATACSTKLYPISDHYDGERFFNPHNRLQKSFRDFLKWQWEGGKKPWPDRVENTATPNLPQVIASGEVHATFINHSTFLLQFRSLNVLTDPIFSGRTSPVSFAGPKRVRSPGLAFEKLPKIDVVVVSHNHYDHLDLPSLERLDKTFLPLFIVPLGNRRHLEKVGIKNIIELDWWNVHEVKSGVSVTSVPAQHWSSRTPFDRNRSLWSGFVIAASGVKVYFAGDTGYGPHFNEIAEKIGALDLSLLPIGSYEPRWFMSVQHTNPDDAVRAHQDLKTKKSLGIHFGCFQLANDGIEDPVIELNAALKSHSISNDDFLALETGETIVYDQGSFRK